VTTRKLDSSIAESGPHAFAVRFSATRQRHLHVHRIPPHVRDDAYAPCRGGTAASKPLIWGGGQDFFCKSEIALIGQENLAFRA
jgi:hypothetical protein